MRTLITNLFGTYTPFYNTDSSTGAITIVEGIAGVDWEYLCGVFLFGICLYSFFRVLGILFKD